MGPTRPACFPACTAGRRVPRAQAGGVGPTVLGALLAILIASTMVMVSSARAIEAEEFTWTGACSCLGPAPPAWSNPLNWASDTAPGPFSTVGRLTFPELEDGTCALGGRGEECYASENDVPGLKVESLSIDDGYPYNIKGEPITLGAGGLTATTSTTASGLATLRFPIELASPQTWEIDGNEDHGGLGVYGSVTGSSALEVKLSGETYFEPDDIETGPITVSGEGMVWVNGDGPGRGLNASDGNPVTLKGATLDAVYGGVGPLTSIGGLLYLTAQSVTALSVAGNLTLDSASSVQVNLEQDVNAELGYGRVETTGNVKLGGARFVGIEAATNYGECPRLNPGDVYTLIKSDGSVEGTFAGTPNGTVLSLFCVGGVSPTVRINYTPHTVTATAVTPGEPLRPASISSPSISGSTLRGQTLTAVPGTWTGSPTAFGYEWERCTTPEGHVVCFSIPEADEETYTLQASDLGYKMRVREVAENSYGVGVPAYSPLSAVVAEPVPPPSLVSPPSIQGNAVVGQILTEVHGSWMGSPTSYSYLWSRCEREQHCSAIPGATAQTYSVQAADAGYTIVVQETAHNANGPSAPATSPETGRVPPLVSSGGGGSNGGGGSSGGGGGAPQAPQVSSVSSPIGGTKLPGGPVSGGTQLTITGSGFVPGATQVWIEPYGWSATGVVVQSSTRLTAVSPNVGMIGAGMHTIRVNTSAGSSSTTASPADSFYYYVPQIGTLVFRNPSLPRTSKDYLSYCTASVVASSNKDVISTAGHCITTGTTWHDEVVFAPGYYGPLCSVSKKSLQAEEALTGGKNGSCGIGPYGFWHSRSLVASPAFMTRHPTPEGVDFGFIAVQAEGGKHIEEVVGGGLPIEFCAGTLAPLHLSCEAGSGATEHNWIAYGQPGTSLGHCGPLAKITAAPEHNGPENLFMEPCVAITSGGSGGPWINLGGHVGAVNQTHCGPLPEEPRCPNPQSTELTGTYFTREAEEAYDEAQRGMSSAALPAIANQNAVVASSGVVSLLASCPGSTNCQGLATLSIQGPLAVAAVSAKSKRKPKQPSILLGRSRFSIHSGSTAVIRIRISKPTLSRLWPRHARLKHRVVMSTLMLHTAQGVTKVTRRFEPVTASLQDKWR